MENKPGCSTCPMRAKYDVKPKSFAGRFWRWHIKWCPGWKQYIKTLPEPEKKEIFEKYNLKN